MVLPELVATHKCRDEENSIIAEATQSLPHNKKFWVGPDKTKNRC